MITIKKIKVYYEIADQFVPKGSTGRSSIRIFNKKTFRRTFVSNNPDLLFNVAKQIIQSDHEKPIVDQKP